MAEKKDLLNNLTNSYDLCIDAIVNAAKDPNSDKISWLEDELNIAELNEVLANGSGFECFERVMTELVRVPMYTTLQALEESNALPKDLDLENGLADEFVEHLFENARF